jgi:hypothetical protein
VKLTNGVHIQARCRLMATNGGLRIQYYCDPRWPDEDQRPEKHEEAGRVLRDRLSEHIPEGDGWTTEATTFKGHQLITVQATDPEAKRRLRRLIRAENRAHFRGRAAWYEEHKDELLRIEASLAELLYVEQLYPECEPELETIWMVLKEARAEDFAMIGFEDLSEFTRHLLCAWRGRVPNNVEIAARNRFQKGAQS